MHFLHYSLDQKVISVSDCSVKCGKGTKTITTVTISSAKQTKPDIKFHNETCDSGVECDPSYEYSDWGEWSECPPCIKTIDQKPMKYRHRECKPRGCISGTKEEEQCELEQCPQECPIFRIDRTETDQNEETQLSVDFTMDKGEVIGVPVA